jgi:adenine-specific DNA-methyltransferase
MVGMIYQKALKNKRDLLKKLNLDSIPELNYPSPPQTGAIRKKRGVYYTPKEVTSYICFQAILYNIIHHFPDEHEFYNLFSKRSPHALQNILSHLQKLKILDPACGAGVFLVQSADILFRLRKLLSELLETPVDNFNLKREILLNNIFGVDLFDDAVETTKTRLVAWAHSPPPSESNLIAPEALNRNIIAGNTLIGWLDEKLGHIEGSPSHQVGRHFLDFVLRDITKEKRKSLEKKLEDYYPLHWVTEFKTLMANGGFDIIVGNPPYVFIRGKNFSDFERLFYREKYFKKFQSLAKGKARQSRKMNLFALFIIRSISLLKFEGNLGFIVPNTLLRTTTNDFIRKFILDKTFIQEIVDLKDGIFQGVTASTILLFLQKESQKMNQKSLINFKVHDLLNYEFHSQLIDQKRFFNNPVLAFNIHLDSEFEAIFEQMKHKSIELGRLSKEIIEGIVCRKKDNLFTADPSHPLAKKLLRGKDIGRYRINWKENQYIIYATDTSFTETKLHRARPQWVHEAPEKLLIQRIGGGVFPLQVAYDNSQYYTFASINNLILRDTTNSEKTHFSYKYLLGILNSKLINAFYLLNYSNKSSLTVNISKTFLEHLPIKMANPSTQSLIENVTDYLLYLYHSHNHDTELLPFYDSYLLDSIIYELYFQATLETNLCEALTKYISTLDPTALPDQKSELLSGVRETILDDPSITQVIDTIKSHPLIQRIENLFDSRVQLLKN